VVRPAEEEGRPWKELVKVNSARLGHKPRKIFVGAGAGEAFLIPVDKHGRVAGRCRGFLAEGA
jgi:hypothetical protein